MKTMNEFLKEAEEYSPYMWKIEGGSGKGKGFSHKSTTVDDHLSAMEYHSKEYQNAMKEKRDSDARHHARRYHKHKDQIERLGSVGSIYKESLVEELNEDGVMATGVPSDDTTYKGLAGVGFPGSLATTTTKDSRMGPLMRRKKEKGK